MPRRYWLLKSEPDVYSLADLERDGWTCWEGVRNYQARNNMMEMEVGDEVLFYHSNARPPGVVGLARVRRDAYPDRFAFEKGHPYSDPASDPDEPRWYMVDVEFMRAFPRTLALDEVKADEALRDMALVRQARLSVQPVTPAELERVKALAEMDP